MNSMTVTWPSFVEGQANGTIFQYPLFIAPCPGFTGVTVASSYAVMSDNSPLLSWLTFYSTTSSIYFKASLSSVAGSYSMIARVVYNNG